MDGITGILAAGPAPDAPAAGSRRDPGQVREAAAQFEALLIAHLLKSAREAGTGGWLGGGEDAAGATMIGVAEEHLARVMSGQGGFGLGRMILENFGPGDTEPAQKVPLSGT